MKIARCVGLTGPITVMGNRATIMIGPEWQGDLDQEIGGGTVADHLGPALLIHFKPVADKAKATADRPREE